MIKDELKKYLPLKQEATLRCSSCIDEMAAIEEIVNGVDDPTERLLLHLRYIEGKSWTQVSCAIHYSRAHTMRIHTKALKRLEVGYVCVKRDHHKR